MSAASTPAPNLERSRNIQDWLPSKELLARVIVPNVTVKMAADLIVETMQFIDRNGPSIDKMQESAACILMLEESIGTEETIRIACYVRVHSGRFPALAGKFVERMKPFGFTMTDIHIIAIRTDEAKDEAKDEVETKES